MGVLIGAILAVTVAHHERGAGLWSSRPGALSGDLTTTTSETITNKVLSGKEVDGEM